METFAKFVEKSTASIKNQSVLAGKERKKK